MVTQWDWTFCFVKIFQCTIWWTLDISISLKYLTLTWRAPSSSPIWCLAQGVVTKNNFSLIIAVNPDSAIDFNRVNNQTNKNIFLQSYKKAMQIKQYIFILFQSLQTKKLLVIIFKQTNNINKTEYNIKIHKPFSDN